MNIEGFKRNIHSITPIHDTPIGIIHPYWARKPMNVIDAIITSFSNPDDLILDPFMGSGTTVFSAVKNKRRIIGTDINPLSVFIVEELLNASVSPIETEKLLKDFIKKAERVLLPLFEISPNRFIERERFQVEGIFDFGLFKLTTVEVVSKKYLNGKWSGRKIENLPVKEFSIEKWNKYLNEPVSFSTISLLKNSRIAIPEGAKLSDYYTNRNIICINFLLDLINNSGYTKEQQQACKFLLSSALPLLRLSDKKASSQWPYWRPRNYLTSRNPITVLHDRLKKIIKGTRWLKEVGVFGKPCSSDTLISINSPFISEISIQDLTSQLSVKPKLIVTDPPYSDHVPYLEYSAIWNEILGFKLTNKHYKNEIVNTDAPTRSQDTREYQSRLSKALQVCSELIDDDGLIIWFYQDQELRNWEKLYEEAKTNGLMVFDVISISKQRRSMKTVTTPNRTLDGDLIIVFSKQDSLKHLSNQAKYLLSDSESSSYFDKYVSIIKDALINGTVNELTKNYKNISELILNIK